MPPVDQLARRRINHGQAVRRFVRRRPLGIHARRHPWRPTQCNEDSFPVRCGVNSTRSFTYRKRRNDCIARAVDHCHVPRALIAHINKIVRRFGANYGRDACHSEKNCSCKTVHLSGATSHVSGNQVTCPKFSIGRWALSVGRFLCDIT